MPVFSNPFDDMPRWVQHLRDQQLTDAQARCRICSGLVLPPLDGETRTDETAHEQCFRLDVLRQQVENCHTSDWPQCAATGISHSMMMESTNRIPWTARVAVLLAQYNVRNGTRYHW